jgi:hypothetical protein
MCPPLPPPSSLSRLPPPSPSLYKKAKWNSEKESRKIRMDGSQNFPLAPKKRARVRNRRKLIHNMAVNADLEKYTWLQENTQAGDSVPPKMEFLDSATWTKMSLTHMATRRREEEKRLLWFAVLCLSPPCSLPSLSPPLSSTSSS